MARELELLDVYALDCNACTQQGAASSDAYIFCRSHSLTPSCFFELQLDTASDLAPKPSDKHTRTCEYLALNVSNRMRNTYLSAGVRTTGIAGEG